MNNQEWELTVIETALLCASAPMSLAQLKQLFEASECPKTVVLKSMLQELQARWAEKGLELKELSSGWRFQSRPSVQPYLQRLQPEKAPKYSRAVLETLAIIAWRQPVTRGDIEDIRGVTVSTAIMNTLQERGWIEVVAHRDGPGRPALWATTSQFLDDLGLKSLSDLPSLDYISNPDEALQSPLSLS